MKKRTLFTILIVLISVWAIVGILVTVFYLIPHFKRLEQDTGWFTDDLETIAVEQVHRIAESKSRVLVRKYVYTDYSVEIAERNRTREEKEYPFAKVTVYAECDHKDYILIFEKAVDGSLILADYDISR